MSQGVAICHKEWLYVTRSGNMSQELAICHKEWLYPQGSQTDRQTDRQTILMSPIFDSDNRQGTITYKSTDA